MLLNCGVVYFYAVVYLYHSVFVSYFELQYKKKQSSYHMIVNGALETFFIICEIP